MEPASTEREYVTDDNARKYRDDILTAVDSYKKLVKTYELELTSLKGKYGRLARVLKRVAKKVNVKIPEL